jgi:hypothetical protein
VFTRRKWFESNWIEVGIALEMPRGAAQRWSVNHAVH